MNLEIKEHRVEIWEKIQDLIQTYQYYDQISISSFNHEYYQKIEDYNNNNNRKIVFGFLCWNLSNIYKGINKQNHQISLNAKFILYNKKIVKEVHDKNMTIGVWFFDEPKQYYDFFELGVDVIITDYPKRVAEQLNQYYSDENYLEGCKSIEKNDNNILSCKSCKNGYKLVFIPEQSRKRCKLIYEIDSDLYSRDISGIYQEKNIFAIKMLYSPFGNYTICQKNRKKFFYFEWRFDLYGNDSYKKKFVLNIPFGEKSLYSKLTEKHIKKLNFSGIERKTNKKFELELNPIFIQFFDFLFFLRNSNNSMEEVKYKLKKKYKKKEIGGNSFPFSRKTKFLEIATKINNNIDLNNMRFLVYFNHSFEENVEMNDTLEELGIQDKAIILREEKVNNQWLSEKMIKKDKNKSNNSEDENEENLVGLINIGNTCFMNSILQIFLNIKQLKDIFIQENTEQNKSFLSFLLNSENKEINNVVQKKDI